MKNLNDKIKMPGKYGLIYNPDFTISCGMDIHTLVIREVWFYLVYKGTQRVINDQTLMASMIIKQRIKFKI